MQPGMWVCVWGCGGVCVTVSVQQVSEWSLWGETDG